MRPTLIPIALLVACGGGDPGISALNSGGSEVDDTPSSSGFAGSSGSQTLNLADGGRRDSAMQTEPDAGADAAQHDAGQDAASADASGSGGSSGGSGGSGGAGGSGGGTGGTGTGGTSAGGSGGTGGGTGGTGITDPCDGVYCNDSNPCTTDTCNAGNCVFTPSGSVCAGGTCHNGQCCTGCWTGSSCQAGNTLGFCGDNGEACSTCEEANPCKAPTCAANGTCQSFAVDDYTACPSGQCILGTCTATGGSGEPCTNGSSCDSASLVCSNGTCKHCGNSFEPCCGSGPQCSFSDLTCSSGTCKPCGGKNELCCAGNTCEAAYYPHDMVCVSGKCECGKNGQPCCASVTQCDSGLKCYVGSGYCAP